MSNSTPEIVVFDEKLIEEREYWKERMAEEWPRVSLWSDAASPHSLHTPAPSLLHERQDAHHLPHPRHLTYSFAPELVRQLSQLTGDSPFLLFTTLMAALKACLYRYSGQRRLAVATPALQPPADANQSNLQPVALNAVIIADEVDPQSTFRALLMQVRQTLLDAYAHQRYPLARLMQDLRVRCAPAEACPLFGVAARLAQLHTEMPQVGEVLMLDFRRDGAELSVEVGFGAESELSVREWLRHYEQLLASAVGGVERRVCELEMVGGAERAQLVEDWNRTEREYESGKGVHELIAEQAGRTPEAVAVEDEREAVTYREMEERAERLSAELVRRGVKADELVGVMMERSVGLVVGVLGVLKAGGAYVPVEESYPAQRVREMMSGVRVVVTQEGWGERVEEVVNGGAEGEGGARREVVEVEQAGRARGEEGNAAREKEKDGERETKVEGERKVAGEAKEGRASGENLAYVIYTSGSTGRPKGVMISHRGLVNYLSWCIETYEVSGGQGAPVHSPIGFDLTVTSLFSPLLTGRTVVLMREDKGVESLNAALRSGKKFSLIKVTPAHLDMLSQTLPPEATQATAALVVGGEALLASSLSFWRTHSPGIRIINEYGPTETVVGCCAYEVPVGAEISGAVPIGRPIANTQLYLLDSRLRLAPKGVVCELFIGGDGVARGYLNEPALTAEKFIPNPFSRVPGARLYRTGDLARYLHDGNIEYLGRLDSQVKLRGYRIELQEIEAVLSSHPAVLESVVLMREDVAGDKRLVGYVVVRQEHTCTDKELHSYSRVKLPDYMVPTAFIFMDALPLTRNGKVNRAALPAPEPGMFGKQALADAPRSLIEELLTGIWAQVLRVTQVGVHENFFALGGHSLLAVQLISRVRDAFHVELPLRSVFEAPTIVMLAGVIETEMKAGDAIEAAPITRLPRNGHVPLSFSQQRLWFINQMEPENVSYNIPAAVRINSLLNIAALEKSFNELIKRHEVIRTTFAIKDGHPVGVIAPQSSFSLPVEDLSELNESEREAEALRLAAEIAHQPFDLSRGPLLRARLFKLGTADHILLVIMHHIISDAWSSEIFIREMTALYEAFNKGAASPLPELAVQYADYAHWQQNWLQGKALDAELSYWKRQLDGSPPLLELPTDYTRPAVQTFRGNSKAITLEPNLAEALKELSRTESVTLFMTLLAAFNILLYRYSRQRDILVGSTIANRTRAVTEGLIGCFVNTLVLRTDLTGDPTFRELLKRVRETTLMAFTHQDVPFEMLVKELSPVRSLSHSPLFQVTFDLNNVWREPLELPDLKLSPLALENQTAQFDLSMTVAETERGLETWLQYNEDLFTADTAQRMLENFRALLESIVADPEQTTSLFPLLSGAERERLLVEWNATGADYPEDICIHKLFERQVERAPGDVAVVCKGEQLTFAELNRRANRLAHYLRGLGVGAEVPVGICTERSLDMAVGLLATLKAGGAYLPLDPAYPKDRLAFMLDDARPPVLLTHKSLSAQLPKHQAREVYIDADAERIAAESADNPSGEETAENSAYLIYTSGSTGRPKGALTTHAALVNYTLAAIEEFRLQPSDRFLQFAPFSFDVVVEELFPAWLSGACVVIPHEEAISSFSNFLKLIETERLTAFEVPASFWHQWVQELSSTGSRLPASLRLVIVGCEKMSPKYVAAWRKFNVPLIHIYGLTETTVTSTLHQMPAESNADEPESEPPIGRPIANTQLYLLDAAGQPVPTGVVGELHIGGAGLGRGYLNRPELTAERFIPNPFSSKPGERLYRTGDLARYRNDGNVEFLGRADSQVKIRGFRIELGEIEAALSAHPAVNEAVVIAREDKPGDKRVAAYLVLHGDQTPGTAELRAFVKDRLPDYMVPSTFTILDALPLTPSGKVDRRALPAPGRDTLEPVESFAAPRSAVEETLADIWAQVLDVERVGIHDNFFHLGGHSLLAIQIVSRVREAFQVDLPLRRIFETPTIADLSVGIVQSQAEELDGELAAELLGALENLSEEEIQSLLPE